MGNLADLKDRYDIKVEPQNDKPKEKKPRSPNRRRPWLFKEEDHKDNSMRELRRQSRKEEVSLEEFRKRYRTSESNVFIDEDGKQKNERYKSKRKNLISCLDIALPDEDDRIVADFFATEDRVNTMRKPIFQSRKKTTPEQAKKQFLINAVRRGALDASIEDIKAGLVPPLPDNLMDQYERVGRKKSSKDESVIISENYEMDLKSELLAKEARIKELEAMIAKLEAQNGPLEASKS